MRDLHLPASPAEIASRQAPLRRRAVEQAKRAPFYHGRLDHVDLDRLDDPEEWTRIPILDKDMLRALDDSAFYETFCLPTDASDGISEFWRSGGSTGRPLFYPRTRADLAVAMRCFARAGACAGLVAGQRAHCSFPLGIHPAGQVMARAAERLGLAVLMAGAGTTTPSALQLELIDRLRPQVWMGMSSYGLHLANFANECGLDLAGSPVETVLCSAEPLSAAKREKLELLWGARVRDTFGMTETGMMGAEDGTAPGLRVWSDLFLMEVVDPDTHALLPEGEVGALLVTPLLTNNCTPFLRWLSGDTVSIRHDVPGDGPFSVFPVLRHAHRTSGFFKVRGVNINHAELEDFVFRQPAIADFKAEALSENDIDLLRVSIELRRGVDEAAAVAALREGLKATFEISANVLTLPLGTLVREFETSIKAPRIADRR